MSIIQATLEDAQVIAEIISISNKSVAKQFGITKSNNPKHPSFYNENWVLSDFERGEKYFLYSIAGKAVGCVAFEQPSAQVGYLNRLSVIPASRRKGIGEELTKFVFNYGKGMGVSEISIGIIAKHIALKNWYKKLGFVENGMKEFSHLPFDVLFMKYEIQC